MTPDPKLLLLRPDAPPEGWRIVAADAAPPDTAARGRAAAPSLQAILDGATWSPIDLRVPGMYRADTEPKVIQLVAEGVVAVHAGAPTEREDMLVFDTRDGRVILSVVGLSGRELIVDVSEGSALAWDPGGGAVDLPDTPGRAVELPPVDPVRWLGPHAGADWLRHEVAALSASPSVVDRISAVGAVLRFGDDASRAAARAWLSGVGKDQIALIIELSIARADALADAIDRLDSVPPTSAARAAAAIVRERDDLQSVRRALNVLKVGEGLSNALMAIDDAATAHATTLGDLLLAQGEDPDAERWAEVSWREPEAWWAGDD